MSANVSTSRQVMHQVRIRRGLIFGVIIVTALFAFEIFNYSTTEYALSDLLGELKFAGIRWATILSIAFCGIDFAGIARLFTPQDEPTHGAPTPTETWYLFGAWLLAATMNAMLTWWGVSLAVLGHDTLGNAVVERATLLRVVPIFVALLVWLIRVLIIGTFSVAGDSLFSQDDLRFGSSVRSQVRPTSIQPAYASRPQTARSGAQASASGRPSLRPNSSQVEPGFNDRPELTYHPLAASSSKGNSSQRAGGMGSEPARTSTSFRR